MIHDARTYLVKRHIHSRDHIPTRPKRNHEKKEHYVGRIFPEWFGLACLAMLCLCICSLLSEGIKLAMLNDLDRESTGRILSLQQRRKNTTIANGNMDYGKYNQIRGNRKLHGDDVDSRQAPRAPLDVVGNRLRPTHNVPSPHKSGTVDGKSVKSRRILALGGSTTWGAKLESRSEAFPTVLSSLLGPEWETVNVAIRATGASLPSQCVQTMITDAGYANQEFDVILLEYSLNGLQNMQYLVKRLRRRYPKATFVYVDLYALRMSIQDSVNQLLPKDILNQGLKAMEADQKISKMILETPKSNWVWSKPMVNFAKKLYLEAFDIVAQVDGYTYEFPMPQAPADAMQWFGQDFHHLNAAGHQQVARGLLRLLDSLKVEPPSPSCHYCDGTWGKGDICFSWFETGETPRLGIKGGTMLEFAPSKYALHIGKPYGPRATVTFSNPFPESQPIEISYMSWRDPSFYPRFRATLIDETGTSISVNVNPINPVHAQRIYHITVSTPLGWAKPGRNVLTIEPTETKEVPARLIGIIMCGACAEMNYTSAG